MSIENREHEAERERQSVFVRKVWLSPLFYVYFLSVLTALGMLYIHRENMVNRNSISPDIAVDSLYNAPIDSMPPGPASSGTKIDLSTLLQPSKPQLDKGGQLFKVDCSPCHGLGGKGDGPASASLNPKPRDFQSSTGWKNGRLLSQMFKTVSEGIPGSAMVSFAGSLPASDRLAIIDYIRSSFGEFPKDTPEQLEAMNKTYHLEKVQAPAIHITVNDAVRQIEESAIPQVRTATAVMAYVSVHPADDGSKIFNGVVADKRRALDMLAGSGFWSKSQSDFVNIVTQDAVQNGFDPKVAQLNTQQMQILYNYLKALFSNQNLSGSQDAKG
ncbi:MAG TPA: cytochrome c [Candidatus Kryptonia bacterium]